MDDPRVRLAKLFEKMKAGDASVGNDIAREVLARNPLGKVGVFAMLAVLERTPAGVDARLVVDGQEFVFSSAMRDTLLRALQSEIATAATRDVLTRR